MIVTQSLLPVASRWHFHYEWILLKELVLENSLASQRSIINVFRFFLDNFEVDVANLLVVHHNVKLSCCW